MEWYELDNSADISEEDKLHYEQAEQEFRDNQLKEIKDLLGEKLFTQLFETETARKYRFLETYKCHISDNGSIKNKNKYELWKFPKELNIINLQGYWRYESSYGWAIKGGEPTECWSDYCFIKIKDKYLVWWESNG